ncbi:MAG: hypothetical protein ACTSR2_11450 [Candidatus Hodarchaeales archaeon]
MLLTPRRKIVSLRIAVVFALCTTFLSIFFLVQPTEMPNIVLEDNIRGEQYTEASQGIYSKGSPLNSVITYMSFLIVLSCSLVTFCLLFLWTPSFVRILPKDSVYKMKWKQSKLLLPERVLVIDVEGNSALIRRNRFSIGGLFLNNYVMEVHIQKENITDIEGLMSHIGITKFVEKESEYIGHKIVSLSNLPVQIVQFKAILSVYTKSSNFLNTQA